MEGKQRIVVVEGLTLLRQGMCCMISSDPDFEVVGETDNGRDAIKLATSASPELIIMDLCLPGMNGIEAMVEIKRRHPLIKVLVLTQLTDEKYIREALKAGADGYVLKHISHAELMLAVKSVLIGKVYLSPDISKHIVSGYLDKKAALHLESKWDAVSLREREILKLIAEGHPNKYIANYLSISEKTVRNHRTHLMNKLDIHNAAVLTAFAIEKGVVEMKLQTLELVN